jgi:hypothetical protein
MSAELSVFQELLQEAYRGFLDQQKKHRVSDGEFARWLGVKQSTFSHWISGDREPDFASAIQLSKRLGPRVFDALGYPRVVELEHGDIKFIVDNWPYLDTETRKQIYDHVREETEKQGGTIKSHK